MAKDIKEISLLDLLPSSVSFDAEARGAARALDAELQKVTGEIRRTLLVSRIDELPESVIDLLAWQWHVDFYDPVILTLAKKRQLIKQSLAWHRAKGTPAAVGQMISTVYAETGVLEWYEYGGEPYHFRVRTESPATDTDGLARLRRMVFASKNVRSWFDGVDFVYKPIDDVGGGLSDDGFSMEIGVGLEDDVGLGFLRYRKPRLVGRRFDGAACFDGAERWGSHYTADIAYGDPASPELYYEEGDAAKLFICYEMAFSEKVPRLYWNGAARFDGSQTFDGGAAGVDSYDGGLTLTVEHLGGAVERIKF